MSVTKMAGICSLNPTTLMTLKRIHGIRCCSGATENENKSQTRTKTPQILKLAVSGVTELLRVFSFSGKERLEKVNNKDRDEISVSGIDDLIMILKSDYEKAYFVTGVFTSEIYDEDCIFEDPTIKFQGTKLYSRNLKLLVPFFDCPSIGLQNIEKGVNSGTDFVLARWKLRTYLKLAWRPLISIDGSTVYELDNKLKVLALFPSSQGLEVTWSSVVKIAQSLYREGPGKDPFRPDQRTPVKNFFLAGSYTKQDYIDSMEGATLSGRQASAYVCGAGEELVALRKTLAAVESQESTKSQNVADELSLA